MRFHTVAANLIRSPTGGMRSPSESSANQAGSSASSGNIPIGQSQQGHERTEAASQPGDAKRQSALAAADTGERGRQEQAGAGGSLLPFGQQFPSLTSLLPSPLRSLFGRGGHERDLFSDFLRDPFFSPLLPLSPALPSTAGATAAAPAVSRGVWDVDAELANPIQGLEVEETDEAYVMKTKLSPAIRKKVAHTTSTTHHTAILALPGVSSHSTMSACARPLKCRTCTCAWS